MKFYQSGQTDQNLKNNSNDSQCKNNENIKKIVDKVVNNKRLYYPNYVSLIG